jgi:hypothetical protein
LRFKRPASNTETGKHRSFRAAKPLVRSPKNIPIRLSRLPNCCGKAANTGGAGRHGTSCELVVGYGDALNGAPDQITILTVRQVAAIQPVGPLPQVAREMLGAAPMMGADQPSFDVAEQRVNDREELAGIGAFVLDHRGVFQILAEIGAAIAAADARSPRSARGAACALWSRRSDTPHRVHAVETWPRRRAYRGPPDRRRQTTWSDRFGSGEVPFRRSPIRRFLPVAGRTFIYPRARLQPPRLTSAAPGTGKSAGPAEPGQVFDEPLLGPKLHHKLS